MRYVPYIVVALAGMVLGVAGVASLGVGAAYGGTFLAGIAISIPILQREHRAALREREAMARSKRTGDSTATH